MRLVDGEGLSPAAATGGLWVKRRCIQRTRFASWGSSVTMNLISSWRTVGERGWVSCVVKEGYENYMTIFVSNNNYTFWIDTSDFGL